MTSFLPDLEARAGKEMKIPDDVRTFFGAVDGDPKLRDALEAIDVLLTIDDRLEAEHPDVVLLFGFHENRLAAIDRTTSAILRLPSSPASDKNWQPCDSIAILIGDILVDAIDHSDNEEPSYVVLSAMEHAKLPLSYKVKKAFKSLTR